MAGPWENYQTAAQDGPWTKYQQTAPPSAPQEPSTAVDIARSIPGGIAKGVAGVAGIPGDLQAVMDYGLSKLGQWAHGRTEEERLAKEKQVADERARLGTGLPTSGAIADTIAKPFGGYYEPQTAAGGYAQTVSEMVPAAAAPGGPIARAARVIAPGIASEAGGQVGQALGGDTGETIGRVGGAVLGGGVQGLGEGLLAERTASAATPTTQAVKAAADAEYKRVGPTPVNVTPEMANAIGGRFGKTAINKAIQGAEVNQETGLVSELRSLLVDDPANLPKQVSAGAADKVRQAFNTLGRNASRTDENMGRGWFNRGKQTDTALAGAPDIQGARQLWARSEKSQLIDDTIQAAKDNATTPAGGMGYEPALRREFGKLVRSNDFDGFSPAEKGAIRSVANGTLSANVLQRIGKFSPVRGHLTGLFELLGGMSGVAATHGVEGAIPFVAMAAIGEAARQGATAAAAHNARLVSELVRSGAITRQLGQHILSGTAVPATIAATTQGQQ